MPGNESRSPPFVPPVIEVFFKALILAEKENALEIGVDHLLTALGNSTIKAEPVEQSKEPFAPIPHREMLFSSEAKAAIEAAGGSGASGLEQLTLDSLRRALLAARRNE